MYVYAYDVSLCLHIYVGAYVCTPTGTHVATPVMHGLVCTGSLTRCFSATSSTASTQMHVYQYLQSFQLNPRDVRVRGRSGRRTFNTCLSIYAPLLTAPSDSAFIVFSTGKCVNTDLLACMPCYTALTPFVNCLAYDTGGRDSCAHVDFNTEQEADHCIQLLRTLPTQACC